VMNLVSLLIATSVVKYSDNIGLRVGVALGAVLIVVIAIVISKRRSISLSGSGPEQGAAIGGARGPDGTKAAVDGPGTKADAPAEQTTQAPG